MSPRSRERLRTGLKGLAPSEMEPRTSDGELITDLLAKAGTEFERKSSVGRAHAAGSSPSASSSASVHSPFHVRPLLCACLIPKLHEGERALHMTYLL